MQVHIETERFLLRDVELTDVEGIFQLDSDPEVHQFLGKKPIKTLDEALEVVKYIRGQYEKNKIGRWAIIDKENNDFIGWTGLKYEENVKEFGYYDLGYRLRKEYWGQGIASETALLCLNYGFEQLKLGKIVGAADVDNLASNKILSKVGLKFIETFEYDGKLHNWYELTKSEWVSNQTRQSL